MQATAAIIGDRTGRPIPATSLSSVGNHISLGRKDGIFQLVGKDARGKPWALHGRAAARLKAAILGTAAWSVSHPTFGRPDHRYRSATGQEHSPDAVAA